MTTATTTTTLPALTIGDKFRVVKGCRALDIAIYATGYIRSIEVREDYSVRLVLALSNGKAYVLWARHPNRLADDEVNLNNGDPFKKIRIARVAK